MNRATSFSRRPELSQEELQQLRWLLGGLLSLLALMTVAYMDIEGLGLMLAAATVLAATTAWPTLPARVPRLAHVLAFPFIASFFALDLWLRSELLPAMVRLDLLLLLYRGLVYRKRREDLQLIILGLFLVIVAGVLTVSLLFAVQILAYAGCALLFLLVLTLLENSSDEPAAKAAAGPEPGGQAVAADPSPVPRWAVRVQWRRLFARVAAVLDARLVLLGTGLFGGVVVAAALLFLVIPRFQLENGMFLERFISKKAKTGFSDSIKFGDVTEIQQDTSVAAHIDVSDPGQIPLAPYWRMLVLDSYENGAFRISPALRGQRFGRSRTGSVVFGAGRARRGPMRWTIFLEPGVSRYLPLLGPFQQLRFAEPQTYQNAPDLALVALVKEPVTMTAYQVEAFDLSARLHDAPGGHYALESALALGAADVEALRGLAAIASAGSSTATAFAGRVGNWLRERHAYSLSPRIPAGPGDPLVRWVQSREGGHCELFAGSFVLLARAAGYRARVVTGFRGGTWNAFANSFTLRNSDAHAWAEIYDRDSGSWLRADPLEVPVNAAGAANQPGAALARRTDRSWAARMDSLRVFWYRRVISFDEQTQVQTLKVVKELAQSGMQRLRDRFGGTVRQVRGWLHEPWNPGRAATIGSAAAGLLALGLGWRWLRVAWLRLGLLHRGARRDDPIRREAGRWLRRLRGGDDRAEYRPTVSDLQRLRFGARQTWPDPGRVFSQARRAARRRRQETAIEGQP